jgi:transposase
MNNPSISPQATVFCGIDVRADTLAVAVIAQDQPLQQREFANRASGHKALIRWLKKGKSVTRVSMEATGIYSLDVALALDAAEGIEAAVLNPKLVNRFAQTLRRCSPSTAAVCRSCGGSGPVYRRSSCAPLLVKSSRSLFSTQGSRTVCMRRRDRRPHHGV